MLLGVTARVGAGRTFTLIQAGIRLERISMGSYDRTSVLFGWLLELMDVFMFTTPSAPIGAHCQVGGLVGAAHVLNDNANALR